MQNSLKRLLAMLLALVLLVGTAPLRASAALNLTGTWQTDLTMSAADLGVNAPDSVLRATLTFTEDGHVTADWEAVDLTAFRIFFHDMFVNAYYAVAYGAGITDINEIEQFCMDSTGMSVSAYMDTLVTEQAITAAFTPAPTQGLYLLRDGNVYLDMILMGLTSDPEVPNPVTREGNTMYLNAASFGKSDFTFTCTRLSPPVEEEPVSNTFPVGYWYNHSDNAAIHGIEGQRMDNGDTRYTVNYSVPLGSQMRVLDNEGNLHYTALLSGTSGFFYFDFCQYQMPAGEWHIQITNGSDVLANASVFGDGSNNSGGNPTGAPFTPYYDAPDSELVTLHNVTAQYLDNGFVRLSLDYTARTDMNITAFSPPNGDLFSCRAIPTVPGQRATFTFDVSVQHLQESGLTLNFYDHTYGPAFGMIDLFRNENETEIA